MSHFQEITIGDIRFKLDTDALPAVHKLEEKYQNLAKLEKTLPKREPHDLQKACQLKEAVSTSLFEQVAIPNKEAGINLLQGIDLTCPADAKQELINSLEAAKWAKNQQTLDCNAVKNIQGLLMAGLNDLRPPSKNVKTGDWRKIKVRFGSKTGLEVNKIPETMDAFAKWLNHDAKELHPIVAAWVAQYIFVHIHPFEDGNGRTSRIIAQHILDKADEGKFSGFGLVNLSESLNNDRINVLRCLDNVSKDGGAYDLTVFVKSMARYQGQSVDNSIEIIKQSLGRKLGA